MNSSPSSRSVLLVCTLLVAGAVVTAGIAAAVTVSDEDVPAEAEAGTEVTAQVELQELYADDEWWELAGVTGLEDATWTVEGYADGDLVLEETVEGGEFSGVMIDEEDSDHPTRVTVTVEGTAPAVESYSYESPEEETFDALLVGEAGEGAFDTWSVRHYSTGDEENPGTRDAREALDAAADAIATANEEDVDVSDAEATFDDGVAAYDEGNLVEALSLAEEAEQQADDAVAASSETDGDDETSGNETAAGDTAESGEQDGESDDSTADDGGDSDDGSLLGLLLYAGMGVIVLAIVGGGAYVLLQRGQGGASRDPLG